MNVVVVEDEKPSARHLKRLIEKQKLNVVQLLYSVQEAVAWFETHPHPDLIFLDIQLSDGLSFEIFDKVDLKSPIVFTTAYDEYALKAFKLNSVDYLLKPIDEEELAQAINKYRDRILETPVNLKDIHRILEGGKVEKQYKNRFSIKVGQHLKVFTNEEIGCFYSENKGTYLNTTDNRNYLMETTLENLETEVSPEKFFRANRKFLINLNAIDDIISYSNSRLKIKLKSYSEGEIIVSRERVRDFRKWLG